MSNWKTRAVVVGDLTLTVDVSPGAGIPILLLHGIPGWRGTWHAAGARLARRHAVVIPDLAGFGASTRPVQPMHAAEHARVMMGLLDALQIDTVHVAGFDFGGPIALSMLASHPRRVASVTLLATNTFTDTPIPLPLKIARVPLIGDAAFRVMMGKLGLTLMWHGAVRRRQAFPRSRYRQALQFPDAVRTTRDIFVRSLRHLDDLYRPIEAALGRVAVPATVIWGDSDPFFSLAVGRRTAGAIAGATFLVLRDCGHFVPEECAEEVAAAIASVVERHGAIRNGEALRPPRGVDSTPAP